MRLLGEQPELQQWPPSSYREQRSIRSILRFWSRRFDSVWDIVQARDPLRDVSKDDELKAALGEKLIALANLHGVSDPETLRGQLLGEADLPSAIDGAGKTA